MTSLRNISKCKMVECAVVGCSNRTPRDSKRGISFYRLPLKIKPFLKGWLVRIKRANLPKLSQCHVCSEYFERECFKSCCNLNLWPGRKREREFIEDAVPSIFLHQQTKSRRLASERIRLDLGHNPSSFDTIRHILCCPELMHVRSDVTKWR